MFINSKDPLYIGIGVSAIVTILFCTCTFCYVCIRNICFRKYFDEDPVDNNIPFGEALRPSEGPPVEAIAEIVSVRGERDSMRRFVNSIITIDPAHIIGAFFPSYSQNGRASEAYDNNDGTIEMIINPRFSASQARRSSLTNYSLPARPGGTSFNQSFALNNGSSGSSMNRHLPQIIPGGANRMNTGTVGGGPYQLPVIRGPSRDSGSSNGSSSSENGSRLPTGTSSPVDVLARFEATGSNLPAVAEAGEGEDEEEDGDGDGEGVVSRKEQIVNNNENQTKEQAPSTSSIEDHWADESSSSPPPVQTKKELVLEMPRGETIEMSSMPDKTAPDSVEPAFETASTASDIFDAALTSEPSFTPSPEYIPTPILLAASPQPKSTPASAPTSASQRNVTARLSSRSRGSNSLSSATSPISPLVVPSSNTSSSIIPTKAISSSSSSSAAATSTGTKPLRNLTMDEVINLLTTLQMTKFKQIFIDNEISGRILCEMETGEDLVDMEVKLPKPHERMFLKVLSDYRANGVPLSSFAPS